MASSRKSSSADLAERISLPAGSSILVGLSGGVDSVVLLDLLHQLAPRFSLRLSAMHVHHGISRNADAWASFCQDLCERLGIPITVRKIDLAPLRAHGVEAAARKLRYAAFSEQPCDYVALAHHQDDQVETLLLQMLRGAGVKGASAMPVVSENGAQNIVRPLLHCTRDEILAYANERSLEWVEDESNADVSYPRNFLRHRLLPLLEEKFPSYRDTLARSARHFAEADELLDDLASMDGAHAISDGALSISALRNLSHARAKNLLRHFLHNMKVPMPQAVQIDEMLRQVLDARHDAELCIELGDWHIRRFQERIYVLLSHGQFDPDLRLRWQGEERLDWPATGGAIRFLHATGQGVSLERLKCASVTVRLRQGGEALRPNLKSPTRSLKNLFQERGIPPWQRDRLPLIYCGEELVCVPGVAIAAAYQCEEEEAGVRLELG